MEKKNHPVVSNMSQKIPGERKKTERKRDPWLKKYHPFPELIINASTEILSGHRIYIKKYHKVTQRKGSCLVFSTATLDITRWWTVIFKIQRHRGFWPGPAGADLWERSDSVFRLEEFPEPVLKFNKMDPRKKQIGATRNSMNQRNGRKNHYV